EARRLLEGVGELTETQEVQGLAAIATVEAQLLRAEGRPREALAAAERALTVRSYVGITQMVGKAALMEALEAAAELGDTAKIAELLATLDELRPGEFSPLLQALRARFRARLPGRDAHAEFSVAEQLYRDLEMLFHLAVTQLEHAE